MANLYLSLRDAVVAQLNTLTDIGQVKDVWPLETSSADWMDEFGAWFAYDGQDRRRVQCWIVEWNGQRLIPGVMSGDVYIHTLSLHFYRQVDDAGDSEEGFLATMQAVKDGLTGVTQWVAGALAAQQAVVQVEHEGVVQWGRILCHKGRIELAVEMEE